MQQNSNSRGTALGANTTTGAAGIALGNRVVMRGYVDFIFKYEDGMTEAPFPSVGMGTSQTEDFKTSADVDFLFDFNLFFLIDQLQAGVWPKTNSLSSNILNVCNSIC